MVKGRREEGLAGPQIHKSSELESHSLACVAPKSLKSIMETSSFLCWPWGPMSSEKLAQTWRVSSSNHHQ